jgi:hypothetical protein
MKMTYEPSAAKVASMGIPYQEKCEGKPKDLGMDSKGKNEKPMGVYKGSFSVPGRPGNFKCK